MVNSLEERTENLYPTANKKEEITNRKLSAFIVGAILLPGGLTYGMNKIYKRHEEKFGKMAGEDKWFKYINYTAFVVADLFKLDKYRDLANYLFN